MNGTKKAETKKPRGTRGKRRGIILKAIAILFVLLAAAVAFLSIWHHILLRYDAEIYENAYGEYYITENGDRINYTFYDSDSDKVAVILPGFGSSTPHYEFDALAKALNDDYKIVIFEPLGYGLSSGASSERTVKNCCYELHRLMQSLGYDKYTLIGHSISGIYALYYSNTYTEEVEAFIGIDASVPHQLEMHDRLADPDNQYKLYKLLRPVIFGSGGNRVAVYREIDGLMAQIPTLTEDDRDIVRALCSKDMTDTQLDEMRLLSANMKTCYDMKFPESVPVLYVLSKESCGTEPRWEQWHSDIVESLDSKTAVIEGSHYLHHTNLDGLLAEIDGWIR